MDEAALLRGLESGQVRQNGTPSSCRILKSSQVDFYHITIQQTCDLHELCVSVVVACED